MSDIVEFCLDIEPMGAVRSNGARSLGSPRVQKYVTYKKTLQYLLLAQGVRSLPEEIEGIDFYIPIPDPTKGSKAKREEKLSRIGKPHQQKPDWDNLAKAVIDACTKEDSHIWRCGEVRKYWTEFGKGKIIIKLNKKYVLSLSR